MSFFWPTEIHVTEICQDDATLESTIQSGAHNAALVKAFRIACKELGLTLPKEYSTADGEKKLGEAIKADLANGWSNKLTGTLKLALDRIRVKRKSDTVDSDLLEEFLENRWANGPRETAETARTKIMEILGEYVISSQPLFDYDSMLTEATFLAKLDTIPVAARLSTLQHEIKKLIKDYGKPSITQFIGAAVRDGKITKADKKKIVE